MTKSLAILASWNLVKVDTSIFIPMTHYLYLEYASEHFDRIYLISPLSVCKTRPNGKVLAFPNVEVIPLPPFKNYLGALKNVKYYYKALKSIRDRADIVYCRVPDPFSWLPALMFPQKTIMHFVGDAIDATKHNEKWNWLKKQLMILGYLPDYWLTLKAARKSHVYTNGHHLAQKLARHGIIATPVISSTVIGKDLHDDFKLLPLQQGKVVITYIGYVRFAKGMKCLMQFCRQLKDNGFPFHFHLVGDGEMYEEVKVFLKNEMLTDYVTLHGYMDDRAKINEILRSSDLFFFPSLSEGSPRVVIEAMAQGTPVLSTPVGSLPTTFKDGESIRFFDFNDAKGAVSIVKEYFQNPIVFEHQRQRAYQLVVKHFTIEKFLSTVFQYEA